MLKQFLKLPRRQKQLVAVVTDYVLLVFAFWSALALRFETLTPGFSGYGWQMLVAPLLAIPIFIRLGLYRAVIRFMEDRVLFVVVGGVTLSVLLLAALIALTHATGLSRGVLESTGCWPLSMSAPLALWRVVCSCAPSAGRIPECSW